MPSPASILRRCLGGALIALFAVVLLAPSFQKISRFPKEKPLIGVRFRTTDFPPWTPASWIRGEFSAAADEWIREHAGLRGWGVYLNRQLRYVLFGQLASAPLHNRSLVVGQDNVLFERLYLSEALRQPVITPEKMDDFGFRLARMQRILREQGMAFLVILAPNKTLLYSDKLPPWAQRQVADDHSDFPAFLAALQRHGVNHLDTMALFRQLRPDIPDLVAPHSSHWSYRGAWVAWQHAIPLINQQGLLPELPVPQPEDFVVRDPIDMDDELRVQLNLFSASHGLPAPAAYPVVAPPPPGSEPVIDALVIGDSYSFGLTDAMARSHLCRHMHQWFYLRTAYEIAPGSFDSRQQRLLTHREKLGIYRSTDESGRLFFPGKNLVILVMTTFNIDKYSWGLDRLVNRLYGNPADNPVFEPEIEVNLED